MKTWEVVMKVILSRVHFENPGNGNTWTCLQLEGVQCNRDAIGARVHGSDHGRRKQTNLHHLVGTGGSFGSNSCSSNVVLAMQQRSTALQLTGLEAVQKPLQIFL